MRTLTRFSKENRKKLTCAEKAMWVKLRNWKIKFRSQRTFEGYIVDFLIPEKRIIVEVDGTYHQHRIEYDSKRTKVLEGLGFEVIRLTNDEVMNGNIDWLKEIIEETPSQKITDVKKAYGHAIY